MFSLDFSFGLQIPLSNCQLFISRPSNSTLAAFVLAISPHYPYMCSFCNPHSGKWPHSSQKSQLYPRHFIFFNKDKILLILLVIFHIFCFSALIFITHLILPLYLPTCTCKLLYFILLAFCSASLLMPISIWMTAEVSLLLSLPLSLPASGQVILCIDARMIF